VGFGTEAGVSARYAVGASLGGDGGGTLVELECPCSHCATERRRAAGIWPGVGV